MSIFDRFRSKKVVTTNPNSRVEVSLVQNNLEQAPDHKNKDYMKEMKNWVYPNINAIAEPVSNIEFELYKIVDGDVEEVEQHPALDLLSRCNDFMTQHKVIFTYVMHRKLNGEAAWLVARSGGETGEPVEIWPLRPDWITIVPGDLSKNEYIKHFIYKIEGKERIIPTSNLIFFTDPNPENPYRGLGVIKAGAAILDVDNYARDWNKNLLWNGGSGGEVYSTEQRLTDEALKRIEKQMRAKHSGTQNAGKFIILEGGLKLENSGNNPKDLDFNVGRERSRDEIAAMFRNPKTVLGITDDVNRANAEATTYVHAKDVIYPEMKKLVDELNEFLLPMFKGTENMFLWFKDPVPENYELKFKKYELVNKVYTINEARAEEGLEPIEGGDVIYQPINLAPLDANGNPLPVPTKMLRVKKKDRLTKQDILKKKFAKEIQRIENRNLRDKKIEAQIEESLKKVLQTMISKKQPTKVKTKSKKVEPKTTEMTETRKLGLSYQKVLHHYIGIYENKVKSIMKNKWYPKLEKDILSKLPKSKKSIIKALEDDVMFDEDMAVKSGIDLFTPLMETLATDIGKEALQAIASGSDYQMSTLLDELLKTRLRDSVVSIAGTAKDELSTQIREGVKNGEGIPEIRDRIKGWFEKDYQAERFARTEVAYNANAATTDAWRESGLVEKREWVVDGNPCSECQAMDGEKTGIDEPFSNGEDEPTGIHPNCLCSTAPIFSEEKRMVEVKPKKLEVEDLIDSLLKEI